MKTWAGRLKKPQTWKPAVSLLHCFKCPREQYWEEGGKNSKNNPIIKSCSKNWSNQFGCYRWHVSSCETCEKNELRVSFLKTSNWQTLLPYNHNNCCHLTWLLRFTRHFNLSGEYSVGLIWHIEKLTYPPIWNPLSACSYNQLPNLLSVNIFVNSIWLNLVR